MTIEKITEGLRKLLLENNYNASTIRFYEREWNKIHNFLMEEYGNTEYQMERRIFFHEASRTGHAAGQCIQEFQALS